MTAMLSVVRPIPRWGKIHLGWHAYDVKGTPVVWNGGAVPGFLAYIGFDPKRRVGVVVLSNARDRSDANDIAEHLLNPRSPLRGAKELEPRKRRQEVAIDPALLDRYTGRYQFPEQRATVTRKDGCLLLQGDDEVALFDPLHPENDRDFFSKRQDIQLRFQVDANGRVTGFLFYGGGRKTQVVRIN